MRLCGIVLLLVVLLSLTAEAKAIVYVSSLNAAGCNFLTDLDKLFCKQLESLGYNITTVWEDDVSANTTTWQRSLTDANLIFLGNVSNKMVNQSLYQPIFCGNISSTNKPIVAAFMNAYNNTTGLTGCAFDILGISYPSDNENKCEGMRDGMFKVTRNGYVTYGFSENDNIKLYTDSSDALIYGAKDANLGWVSTNCDPPGLPEVGRYTIIENNTKGVFWGLDRPDLFTSVAWKIFNRTILYILNDWRWDFFMRAFPNVTAPVTTINKPFNIRANITWQKGNISSEPITINITGPANQLITTTVSDVANKNITFTTTGTYNVIIEGEGSSAEFPLNVGDLETNILSGDYTPNSNYTINASVYSQGLAYSNAVVRYSIINQSFTELANGTLTWNGANYGGIVSTQGWDSEIILSVIAENTTTNKYGATYKIIGLLSPSSYTELATDKNIYKPGEIIIFYLTSTSISNANITNIISPAGTSLLTNATMYCYVTYCTYSWTSGTGSANGTYTAKAKAIIGGVTVEKQKDFDIVAWNMKAYTDKFQYKRGENITLSVEILDAYTDTLAITADINISTLYKGRLNFQGQQIKNVIIPVNSSWSIGTYTIFLTLNDSDGRVVEKNISFIISEKGIIDVTPASWNISTNNPGIYNKTFTLKNTGNLTVTNIAVILPNISILSLNTSSMTDNLPTGENTSFTVFANITREGNWSGMILLMSSVENITIPLSASYYRDTSLSFLETSPSSLKLYTPPDKQAQKTIELKNTGGVDAINLSYEASGLTGLTASGIPETITAGGSKTITINLDATGMTVGEKSGALKFSSSVGNTTLSVTAVILNDLKAEADGKLIEIDAFLKNISKITDKSKINEIMTVVNNTKSKLQEVKEKWENKDYEAAYIALNQAKTNISQAQDLYNNALSASAAAAKQSAGLIWIFAFIVIIVIIAITAYKYRAHIKQIINNIIAKLQKKEEQEKEEVKPPPKQEEKEPEFKEPGQYRTEYY